MTTFCVLVCLYFIFTFLNKLKIAIYTSHTAIIFRNDPVCTGKCDNVGPDNQC